MKRLIVLLVSVAAVLSLGAGQAWALNPLQLAPQLRFLFSTATPTPTPTPTPFVKFKLPQMEFYNPLFSTPTATPAVALTPTATPSGSVTPETTQTEQEATTAQEAVSPTPATSVLPAGLTSREAGLLGVVIVLFVAIVAGVVVLGIRRGNRKPTSPPPA